MMSDQQFQFLKQKLTDYKNQFGSPLASSSLPGLPKINQQPKNVSSLESLGTVLKSGANVGAGLLKTVTDPYTSVSDIGNILWGSLQTTYKGITGDQSPPSPSQQSLQDFMKSLQDRYGSADKLKNTIKNDPVGFALDLSIIVDGLGGLSKLMGATKAGEIAGQVSDVIDPLQVAKRVVKKTASGVGGGGEFMLGLTTRRGPGVVSEAYETGRESVLGGEAGAAGQEAFQAGMRGDITEAGVVEKSRAALDSIESQRSAEYNSAIDKLKSINTKSLDISPILNDLQKALKDFSVTIKADGTLDLSRSPLIGEQNRIQSLYNLINDYGTKSGDRTVSGLDILKRNINQFRGSDPTLNAFVTKMYNSVGGLLKSEVSGYAGIMTKYGDKSELITSIKKDLSLGDKASVDRGFKNLVQAVRKDSEFKTGLMVQLQSAGYRNLIKEISGINLQDILPDDIFRVAIDISTVFVASTGYVSPVVMLDVLSTSPRLVGELVNALGVGVGYGVKLTNIMRKVRALGGLEAMAKAGYIIQRSGNQNNQGLFRGTETGGSTTIQ